MTTKVIIIDYGIGNLLSVQRAFEHLGANAEICDQPSRLIDATHVILPGVGAFGSGMANLQKRGFVEPIQEYVSAEKPFMGICLGMQLMFEAGLEFGQHRGIGLIPGIVKAIPHTGSDNIPHKIPHIGWSKLQRPAGFSDDPWQGTPLQSLKPDPFVYFVHSFTAHPQDDSHRVADAEYNGRQLAAVVRKGRAYGCQFHPEKSGPVGLQILKGFLEV